MESTQNIQEIIKDLDSLEWYCIVSDELRNTLETRKEKGKQQLIELRNYFFKCNALGVEPSISIRIEIEKETNVMMIVIRNILSSFRVPASWKNVRLGYPLVSKIMNNTNFSKPITFQSINSFYNWTNYKNRLTDPVDQDLITLIKKKAIIIENTAEYVKLLDKAIDDWVYYNKTSVAGDNIKAEALSKILDLFQHHNLSSERAFSNIMISYGNYLHYRLYYTYEKDYKEKLEEKQSKLIADAKEIINNNMVELTVEEMLKDMTQSNIFMIEEEAYKYISKEQIAPMYVYHSKAKALGNPPEVLIGTDFDEDKTYDEKSPVPFKLLALNGDFAIPSEWKIGLSADLISDMKWPEPNSIMYEKGSKLTITNLDNITNWKKRIKSIAYLILKEEIVLSNKEDIKKLIDNLLSIWENTEKDEDDIFNQILNLLDFYKCSNTQYKEVIGRNIRNALNEVFLRC